MSSSSCNKLAGLLDVSFNAAYSVQLDAVVPPNDGLKQTEGMFSASATIDPNSNAEFLKYANKIKDIQINSISAKVLSISKPVTIETASISIFSGTKNTSWNFTNELINAGKILTLGNDSNQWMDVQNILNDKNVFTVFVDGKTDVDDVEFTIEVTINAKITANPLGN
jgi:hypothetical protein